MSKSKQNYVDPNIILDNEGADALRWYLISANAPWMSTRFYEEAVKETLGKFILTFWNSYNFFTTYAALDQFNPENDWIPINKRGKLDQWILSRLHTLIGDIHNYLKDFEIHKAARAIETFVIDDFSNWYLRRSRKRLWVEEKTTDKLSGYSAMYDIFLALSKLLAPFIPFITEEIYQNLRTKTIPESIHLCDYLIQDPKLVNTGLEEGMTQIRELVEIGRALRSKIGVKVRYPLPKATIVCSKEIENSITDLIGLLQEELNVKTITFSQDTTEFLTRSVKPNHAHIGPRFKQQAKQITRFLETMDLQNLYQDLSKKKKITITLENQSVELSFDDFDIIETAKSNFTRADDENVTLFLDTRLSPELEAEGFAREIVRRIQSMRKELDLDVEDRIKTEVHVSPEKFKALSNWEDYIRGETRSDTVAFVASPSGKLVKKWTIDDLEVQIGILK
jgi:isoleucyl-tRNA synthetase